MNIFKKYEYKNRYTIKQYMRPGAPLNCGVRYIDRQIDRQIARLNVWSIETLKINGRKQDRQTDRYIDIDIDIDIQIGIQIERLIGRNIENE